MGVTTAVLKVSGTVPVVNERLTTKFIIGSSGWMTFLSRLVGIGSKQHDFVGVDLMTFSISSTVVDVNDVRIDEGWQGVLISGWL